MEYPMNLKVSISIPQSPSKETVILSQELEDIIPDSLVTSEEEFETRIKIVEDVKPQWIVLENSKVQLVLKIIEYKSKEKLGISYSVSRNNSPQLIASNFSTEVGMKVVGVFTEMFPFCQESRLVANFSVQGDFMHFRLYEYYFCGKGLAMKDVGPHLTLRLWRFVEYFENKRKVMDFKKFVKNTGIL